MHNILSCSLALLLGGVVLWGCDTSANEENPGSAQIIGSIASPATAGKTSLVCPDAIVTVNDAPVDVEFLEDDQCKFFIPEVPVAEEVVISVELASEGLSGVIVVQNVLEDELIEIFVETDTGVLTLSVLRRVAPVPVENLPERIDSDHVEISIDALVFDQDLTVDGNGVTVTGVAGADCSTEDWSTITGVVTVNGNNAIFRNLKFSGEVIVRGNNATFINSCFGETPVFFGNQDGDEADDDTEDEAGESTEEESGESTEDETGESTEEGSGENTEG